MKRLPTANQRACLKYYFAYFNTIRFDRVGTLTVVKKYHLFLRVKLVSDECTSVSELAYFQAVGVRRSEYTTRGSIWIIELYLNVFCGQLNYWIISVEPFTVHLCSERSFGMSDPVDRRSSQQMPSEEKTNDKNMFMM